MLIYNTLTRQKENLEETLGGEKKIRLFVCGPTVYDYIHIGNARTYSAFDTIVRYLRDRGFKVFYLQNITDIDDKIIRRAGEAGVKPAALAKEYEKAYHEDEKKLNINSVTKYARATKYIKEIVKQIKSLASKGHAYKIEGDGYYFDISTFPDYGRLARRTVAQAEDSVSRIDESVNKKNKGDFALWKFSKDDEPYWDSPLGKGRPGWHIEDTAITEYHFGPQYDLHGGAVDLIFPHHEAEIAQQESASKKKPMVKIWIHSGFLNINSAKMSKSSGDFITARDFLKDHSPAVFRYLVASHHYRSPINYSDELAAQSKNTLNNLNQFLAKLKMADGLLEANPDIDSAKKKFSAAMDDDFNSPGALAAIFEIVNWLNPKIWDLNKKSAKNLEKWTKNSLEIFGIKPQIPKIPPKIARLGEKRELFRSNKQFIQSDDLRKEIERLGYTIEDTPRGPFLWPNH